jgi:hypothetical protein
MLQYNENESNSSIYESENDDDEESIWTIFK